MNKGITGKVVKRALGKASGMKDRQPYIIALLCMRPNLRRGPFSIENGPLLNFALRFIPCPDRIFAPSRSS